MKSTRIPSLTTSVNNGQLLLLKPVDTTPLPLISGLLLLTLPLQTVPLPENSTSQPTEKRRIPVRHPALYGMELFSFWKRVGPWLSLSLFVLCTRLACFVVPSLPS